MKRALQLNLTETEIATLLEALDTEDEEAAFAFLSFHFKGKARDLLEGG